MKQCWGDRFSKLFVAVFYQQCWGIDFHSCLLRCSIKTSQFISITCSAPLRKMIDSGLLTKRLRKFMGNLLVNYTQLITTTTVPIPLHPRRPTYVVNFTSNNRLQTFLKQTKPPESVEIFGPRRSGKGQNVTICHGWRSICEGHVLRRNTSPYWDYTCMHYQAWKYFAEYY